MTAKTVEKSLRLLELLARSPETCGVAELGRALKIPKSNVFRLLSTLVANGYVRQQGADGRYEPTMKLWELGNEIVSRANLPQIARPFLARLAARVGESTHLAVFDRGESVYIDKRDGPHPISGFTRIGSRAPAHCVATGKAELAHLSDEILEQMTVRLQRFTPATIRTAKALSAELDVVRTTGVAINRGEWFADVWGVAAPIRNHTGAVCASIGVWGPKERLSNRVEIAAREVKSAANAVSAALGCPVAFRQPEPSETQS